MNQKDLEKLHKGEVGEIVLLLGDMPVEDVQALLALEQADANCRQDLVSSVNAHLIERLAAAMAAAEERAAVAEKDAIDALAEVDAAKQAAADANAKAEASQKMLDEALESGEVSAKQERGAEIKEHLKPDYSGSLNVTQALERNAYMKALKAAEKKKGK